MIIFPPTTIVEIDNTISIEGLDFVPFLGLVSCQKGKLNNIVVQCCVVFIWWCAM
jgi:hypothetical protein